MGTLTRTVTLLAFGMVALATTALAAEHSSERNDIPSCYAWAKLNAQQPAPSGRELVVIIDQTVHMNEALQRSAWAHIVRYLRPGDAVRLYQFSAFLKDHYLRLPFAGRLEAPLETRARSRIGVETLKQFDACLAQQMTFFRDRFGKLFIASFSAPDTDIARSDILASLHKIGADLTATASGGNFAENLGANPSVDRVVLLISDMLENSSVTSFYRAGRVRTIDPQVELAHAQPYLTNFGDARVYVHGAGLVSGAAVGSYRDGETLRRLEQFWRDYLAQSNATLQGFGTPELTTELR